MSKGRLVLGLMSGTSFDGADAALVKFRGTGIKSRPELLYNISIPFPASLRERIAASATANARELCRLNFDLGEVFAKAAIKCAEGAGIPMQALDAIASHGQTICHVPPEGGKGGSTLQLGESAVIAQRTGVSVVSDFRGADMAAGGQGAPLVPFADYVLFRSRKTRAVQNIGGIANVTVVTPDFDGLTAFDTGPGNCMMDAAARAIYNNPFDKDGRIASGGTPDMKLLEHLMSNPYFSKAPPKSTGTDAFGLEALGHKIRRRVIRPEDLLCTLAHFTARSIREAYDKFVLPKHDITEVIVSGGGSKNKFLMALLKSEFSYVPVKSIEEYGIPSGAKEAMSFAILANETLSGNPSNVPGATGASEQVILGKLTMPPAAQLPQSKKTTKKSK